MMKYEIEMTTRCKEEVTEGCTLRMKHLDEQGYDMRYSTQYDLNYSGFYNHKTDKTKKVYHDNSRGVLYYITTFGPFYSKDSLDKKVAELKALSPIMTIKINVFSELCDWYNASIWTSGETVLFTTKQRIGWRDILNLTRITLKRIGSVLFKK